MVSIAVAFYSLARHLTLLHLFAFTAFSSWFLSENARLFDESLLLESTIVLFTREVTPLIVLVVCFTLPSAALAGVFGRSERNAETGIDN